MILTMELSLSFVYLFVCMDTFKEMKDIGYPVTFKCTISYLPINSYSELPCKVLILDCNHFSNMGPKIWECLIPSFKKRPRQKWPKFMQALKGSIMLILDLVPFYIPFLTFSLVPVLKPSSKSNHPIDWITLSSPDPRQQ